MDNYRRQRLFVEMEQMASRPFSHVLVELQVPANFPRRAVVPHHHCSSSDGRSHLVVVPQASINSTGTVETSFSSCHNPVGPTSSNSTVASTHVRRRRRVCITLNISVDTFKILKFYFDSFGRVPLLLNHVRIKRLPCFHY